LVSYCESKSSSTGEPRKRETTEEQKPVLPRSPSPRAMLLPVSGIRKPGIN